MSQAVTRGLKGHNGEGGRKWVWLSSENTKTQLLGMRGQVCYFAGLLAWVRGLSISSTMKTNNETKLVERICKVFLKCMFTETVL